MNGPRWSSGLWQWATVAAVVAVIVCVVGWPIPTLYALVALVAVVTLVAGIRRFVAERRALDDQLTADEARALVDDLSLQLYRAQDALDFVGECCDIADRQGRAITTANVRQWLKGAQCARQAGLVISPDIIRPLGGPDA